MTLGFRKYQKKLGKRYIRSANEGKGTTTVTKLAVLGNTLAVFSIVVALAIRAGFQEQFLETLLGSEPHVSITHASSANGHGITQLDEVYSALSGLKNIKAAYPTVSSTILVKNGERSAGAQLIGMNTSDYAKLSAFEHVKSEQGTRGLSKGQAALGADLAAELGVSIGSTLKLISGSETSNIASREALAAKYGVTLPTVVGFGGSRRAQKTEADASSYVVSHIFKTGNAALDKSRIYIDLNAAQTFTKKKKGADSVEIVLSDPNKTVNLQLKLFERLPAYYVVQTWKEKSEKVLSAMALQDKALFIILAVLISISMLNIISGLVTLVSSKASDIGILRTMGVRRSSVKRIFFLSGAQIGIVGSLLGAILGVIFCMNLDGVLSLIDLITGADPELSNISTITLTAKIRPLDLCIAVFGSMLVSFLITLIPASKAANMNPIDALNDE